MRPEAADPQPDICIGAGCPHAAPAARSCRLALEELRSVLAGRTEVSFAAGFGFGTTDNDEELLQEAVELANGADQVLVFLGLPGEDESEGLAELVAEL
jgi:beta-glucosidase